MAASETYPDDLRYHAEHDWARIEGDEAVLGITWFAQDVQVNAKVVEEPETVNDDPYGDGWLVRVRLTNPAEADSLLDVDAYKHVVAEA